MDTNDVITVLTREQCLEKLTTQELGRVVVRRKDDMDIFPINYVVDDGKIYMRTAQGNKLFSLFVNPEVLFEVDHFDESIAWSVVAHAKAEILDKREDIAHADTLSLRPWLPTLKYTYVRLTPKILSGREFELGAEPERY